MLWGSLFIWQQAAAQIFVFLGIYSLFIAHQVIVTMSIKPFLFELTYPPGEEPSRSQEEDEEEGGELDENGSQVGATQLKIMQRLLDPAV